MEFNWCRRGAWQDKDFKCNQLRSGWWDWHVEQTVIMEQGNRNSCFLGDAQELDLVLFTFIYCRPNLLVLKVCFISIWGCQLRFPLLSLRRRILFSAPLLLSYFLSLACALPHDGVNHFCKLGFEAFSCLSREKYNYFDFGGRGGQQPFVVEHFQVEWLTARLEAKHCVVALSTLLSHQFL